MGYLSLFGILIVGLNDHYTQFVTNVFAYSSEPYKSSFDANSQKLMNYSRFGIVFVDSEGIFKSKDHDSYAAKSMKVSNYVQKESSQDWTSKLVDLMIDSISSVSRMFIALGLSFVAAIVVGITAA